ncbi:hypothetical protein FACS189426_09850 [Bacteroidia bacterium]|nr:hypothetical protein FACS189426_09850 [Bacteroidia bacterium]
MFCASGFNYVVITGFAKLKITKYCFISLIISIIFLYHFSKYQIEQGGNIRESFKFIQRNICEDENIYVYYFATPGYEYYNSIGFINPKAQVLKGKYNRYDARDDFNELNNLHGKTWLLFSNLVDCVDEEFMINYIDSLYPKIKEFKTVGFSAYLYDFGE